jgi:phosphoglycerate dehydrogenase-like enzyme
VPAFTLPLTLVVTADPASTYLKPLECLPAGTNTIISDHRDRLLEIAPRADVLLNGNFRDPGLFLETFRHAPRLKWIHALSAGIDKQLSPEIIASPVPMTNGRGVFGRPLAEWVIGVMIYFAYDIPRVLRNQRAQVWDPFDHEELHGHTLAIIGYGDIGQLVAERARAFGMEIIPLRRNHQPEELIHAMESADYIAITQIAAMKPNAVVINIGRGAVIDEAALIAALEQKKIRGAALDVFTTEPLPAGHPFYTMANVLASPHSADNLPNSRELAVEFFVENFRRFTAGEPLKNIVNKHAGY